MYVQIQGKCGCGWRFQVTPGTPEQQIAEAQEAARGHAVPAGDPLCREGAHVSVVSELTLRP